MSASVGKSRRRALGWGLSLGGLTVFASRRRASGGPPAPPEAGKTKASKSKSEKAAGTPAKDTPFLHEAAWRTTFEGWSIVDCAVRSRKIVYLVIRKDVPPEEQGEHFDSDIPTRFVSLYLDESDPKECWGHQGLADFRRPRCGVSRVPIAQGMAVSANGDVYAAGSKRTGMEQIVEDDQPTSIEKVRCLGDRAYAVGLLREVYRRVEIGRWERITKGIPEPTRAQMRPERLFNVGFLDIDGFADDDLYAVGGKGDVWHFDGRRWTQQAFPARLPLFNVCCAGDGQVYLGGEGGTLYRGRGETWQRIRKAEMTIPYNDVRWFDGRLWLASDYRLDQLVGDEVVSASHAGERVPAWGHMDVGDGLLVIAGLDTVRSFDGTSWRTLVRPYSG